MTSSANTSRRVRRPPTVAAESGTELTTVSGALSGLAGTWSLIWRIRSVPDHTSIRILTDFKGHAAAAWEPGAGALFAVRPDGVVGLASDRQDFAALGDWLRCVGVMR
jgi:hypothetical protein